MTTLGTVRAWDHLFERVRDWIQHGHLCVGEGVLEVIVNQRFLMFFPEANEVTIARHTTFEDVHEGDYLTKPSLFKDSGVTTKVKMAAHLQCQCQVAGEAGARARAK
ncbi:uncharacterized protein [Lolium perenne]|uniref:uncharacterized protein n=1 Tax=Lolium perenne TaxID=4522 RepID=UPI003A993674